jgi:hypothetical protein
MSKFSVVVFEEGTRGRPAEPFLATRDPEVVKLVRNAITNRLRNHPTPQQGGTFNAPADSAR